MCVCVCVCACVCAYSILSSHTHADPEACVLCAVMRGRESQQDACGIVAGLHNTQTVAQVCQAESEFCTNRHLHYVRTFLT